MRVIKTVLFHLLYTFRGLVLLICKLLSGLFLFGFLFGLFGVFSREGMVGMTLTTLAFCVGFGALAFYYDVLLLKLKPEGIDLTLIQ
ncbi:hypothetical protein [Pseudomonas citronellolis]|uniref:hypothetical protein n=1 Tax=Pseudomonas citronellolis TaxID=53408 RepID=UPI0023E46BAE|nr:hypothetical protein [Pseudomonas citronellolis]MDF3933757.1 hypothetical protein [Pseudomonas citronellolis]